MHLAQLLTFHIISQHCALSIPCELIWMFVFKQPTPPVKLLHLEYIIFFSEQKRKKNKRSLSCFLFPSKNLNKELPHSFHLVFCLPFIQSFYVLQYLAKFLSVSHSFPSLRGRSALAVAASLSLLMYYSASRMLGC